MQYCLKIQLKNNITMYQDISDEEVIAILSKVGLDNYANQEGLKVANPRRWN